MAQHSVDLERGRDAARRAAWAEAYGVLAGMDHSRLAPEDLDALADAAFWLCRVDESIAARQRAYSGHVARGANLRAAHAAWFLFYDYLNRGDEAVAGGWLRRMRRLLDGEADCVEQGYLAFAEADLAHGAGRLDEAQAHAERMAELGWRFGDPNLVASALERQAHVLVSQDRVIEGLAVLDEAMCAVVAGELDPSWTGWLYCLAIGVCLQVPDLRRATAWTEAAMDWCATLPARSPYHGLCRVHRVEVMALRGPLADAEAEALRACEDLLCYEPRLAGEAFYVVGEIRRRRGDLAAAEVAYVRAHELGREPQPGLALLRLAKGKADTAASTLRLSLAGETNPLERARLLAAQVEVALATDDVHLARTACEDLQRLADRSVSEAVQATAALACGALQLAEDNADAAFADLRRACGLWRQLDLPYEAAQARVLIAAASRRAGDDERARLELEAARAEFERLGATADAGRVVALLGRREASVRGLTRRELAVLHLLAAGKTNRDIATELVISEHTVARHVSNIFAKLGVSSRAAATAFAFEHELV